MNELISIIVPVYKVEQYLDKCIQSIVDQTYTNLEIILVDDGSPDRCPEMCDTWAMRDSRILVIHKENAGVSAARNSGLDLASGEYLAFVDSDDYIANNLCEKVVRLFSENDVDIVTFDCQQVTETGEVLGGTETICDGILTTETALLMLMQGRINNYLWNKVYRRHVFRDIRCPEGQICFEDMAIMYKAFLKSKRIYCLNEKLYHYLKRSDSATSAMDATKICDAYKTRRDCYSNLKTKYPEAAEIVFSRVVLCAVRLYDRSLWERIDEDLLLDVRDFLEKNRKRILQRERKVTYFLYYYIPRTYKFCRVWVHRIGRLVKKVRNK